MADVPRIRMKILKSIFDCIGAISVLIVAFDQLKQLGQTFVCCIRPTRPNICLLFCETRSQIKLSNSVCSKDNKKLNDLQSAELEFFGGVFKTREKVFLLHRNSGNSFHRWFEILPAVICQNWTRDVCVNSVNASSVPRRPPNLVEKRGWIDLSSFNLITDVTETLGLDCIWLGDYMGTCRCWWSGFESWYNLGRWISAYDVLQVVTLRPNGLKKSCQH